MYIQLAPTMLRRHSLSSTFTPNELNFYRPRNGVLFGPTRPLPLPLDMRNNQNSAQYKDVLPSLHKMAYTFESGFAQERDNNTEAFSASLFDHTLEPEAAHVIHVMHKNPTTKLTERHTGITVTYTPLVDGSLTISPSMRSMNHARAGLAVTGMYTRNIHGVDTVAVLHTYLEDPKHDTMEFGYNYLQSVRLASLGTDTEQFTPRSVANITVQAMKMLTMPITTSMVEMNPKITGNVTALLERGLYHSN